MLYKKYHRNYVRQFRKGAKFAYGKGMMCKVNAKPFIDELFANIKVDSNIIKDGVNTKIQVDPTIINYNGRLIKDVI